MLSHWSYCSLAPSHWYTSTVLYLCMLCITISCIVDRHFFYGVTGTGHWNICPKVITKNASSSSSETRVLFEYNRSLSRYSVSHYKLFIHVMRFPILVRQLCLQSYLNTGIFMGRVRINIIFMIRKWIRWRRRISIFIWATYCINNLCDSFSPEYPVVLHR